MPNILFRVDSSHQIGSGHTVRCLNLARKLRDCDFNVTFVARSCVGNCNFLLEEEGFIVYSIPILNDAKNSAVLGNDYSAWLGVSQEMDARATILATGVRTYDWVIVDHYALDYLWQDILRSITNNIMVIDDLANRRHKCDILLDQNFYLNKDERYLSLVPRECVSLLGPNYLLLSEQYDKYQLLEKVRSGVILRVLVFFGSVDLTRQTELAITAITELNESGITFDIIVGSSNPQKDTIRKRCTEHVNINFHCQVDNMSDFISRADFALGAGGSTTWERCKLGLPTATVIVAENQREVTKNAAEIGVVLNMGDCSKVTENSYLTVLRRLIATPADVSVMSQKCLELFSDIPNTEIVDLLSGKSKLIAS